MLTMKMKYATEYNPADNGVFVEINVKDSRLTDTPPEPQEQSWGQCWVHREAKQKLGLVNLGVGLNCERIL